MESYFYKVYNLHENKYGYIVDENGYELIYINSYNKDSQSYLYKYKLLDSVTKIKFYYK